MKLKHPLVIAAVAGTTFVVFACCAGVGIVALSWNRIAHPERQVIMDHLQKTAHDPSSIEIVEWGVPEKSRDTTTVRVSVRGRNAFGAKILSHQQFYIEDGRVTHSISLD